jgi:prenyltransferase/squalene oxidase-like repeat protein
MRTRKRWRNGLALMALLGAGLGILQWAPWRPQPLWPGSRYTERDREQAVERGLEFIGRIASNPKYFSRWGHDLLWCFYTVSATSKDERLREMAGRMGRERAQQWRHDHAELHFQDADELANFVEGVYAEEQLLGQHDEALERSIQAAAAGYSAADFLSFDPRVEPPPGDVPELCPKCNHRNPRGATRCERCQARLSFRSPYDVWLDALIRTHTGDRYGVKLGASYAETVRWVAVMRPYPSRERLQADEDEFHDVTYAVTHVVYTLDDYGKYRLSADWLRPEFDYLRNNLSEAERLNDGEMLGEFLDTLRALGRSESDPEIRAGVEYLLAHQNPDGSWGEVDGDDIYTRYHSTWTAVDGLRQYSYQGERRPQDFSTATGKREEQPLAVYAGGHPRK